MNICIAAKDNCQNLEESYGEICVRCNKCGRFCEEQEDTEKTMSWIQGYYTNGHAYQRCSNCFAEIEDVFFSYDYEVNYCPQCGYRARNEG